MSYIRLKHACRVIETRVGTERPPLLAVSIHYGVIPREKLTDDQPRADDLSTYRLCEPGDIVLNRMRAFQGAVGMAPERGMVSPDYLVLRPGSCASPRYLHHLLRSSAIVGEMVARLRGIGSTDTGTVRTPRINAEDLLDIRVDLPPVDEQRAIADYLDRETARIDALIAAKETMRALVHERFERAVFDRITGADSQERRKPSGLSWLATIPASWGTPTVSANFEVVLGKMLNAESASGADQRPYLRNTDVQWDVINVHDLPTMSFDVSDRALYSLRRGDLLVCEGGEVGRAATWLLGDAREVYFQKALHRVRPHTDANTRFLMYALRAASSMNVFRVEGNLSTIVHLTREQLRAHRFPWPPVDVQQQIVQQLDRSKSVTELLNDRLRAQVTLLREHRQALITSAVTGQTEVRVAA